VTGSPFRFIRAGRSRLRRGLRGVVVVFLVMLVPTAWSYTSAMLAPGSAPLSAKSVEWIARHGGRGLITIAETWWLDHHKPPVGGNPAGGIPIVAEGTTPGVTSPRKMVLDHLPKPPDVAPVVTNPLPHEGVWQALGRRLRGVPSMYVAYLRPDAVHTSLVSAVVWMDQKLLSTRLVPGVQDPGGKGWSWIGDVPKPARADLAAAFNSGFYIRDSKGGYFSEGRTVAPLVNGAASLVIYKDGTATVGSWGGEVSMSQDVMSVRQNLTLIVDHGKPAQGLTADHTSTWGATYGNTVLAWRSAVGVTQDGALLFGCGDGLSAASLADIMVRAGAVRAMEMDINHVWVTFESFTPAPQTSYGAHGTNILNGMWVHQERYLQVDERDFFAMFLRPASQLHRVAAVPPPRN
jgi:Phosphodiester glycosidase